MKARIAARVALLGAFCLSCAGAPAAAAQRRHLPPGLWGGEHVRVIVSGAGALLEFDCASGRIDRPIVMDGGSFTTQGTYAPEHGGPRRDVDSGPARARYIGRITGDTMRLTIRLEHDTNPVGVFTLKLGNDPLLTKCR